MDDLVTEFLTETTESIEEIDLDLVNLEQNPNDKALLSKIFRLMHTIKGTCGFLALPRLEKVAHHAENVLGRFRDGDLDVTQDYVTLIFESIDRIKFIVREIEAGQGKEPEGDDSTLITRLDEVYEGRTATPTDTAPAPEAATEETAQAEIHAPEESAAIEPESPSEQLHATAEDAGEAKASAVAAQSLRVNVDVLENLMTMVSELVLTRNQLLQIMRAQTVTDFSAPLQRLNHVVSELQEGVMKTRMQPIGNAWSKLPRIIRDLSMELGKKIELEMRGQDTELDRQVLELIKDPLTHMVRNSADHGIEMPEARKSAGKPETGHILLKAYHEGGHIIIEIRDDGKGLSTEKIRKKVIENGLATPEELENMTVQQIQQFIFRAGFSTAEKVTAVSGRGVGMDVVRTNIEKIGGSIELKSVEGKGSTFTIKIPLTLAIVSALIVEAAGERFAIPQLTVRELVMASQHGENRVETIKGTPVFRLRNRLLPLVDLGDLLKLRAHDQATEDTEKQISGNLYIIVAQVGTYQFGIIVDRVFDTEEIVVKPVATILRNIEIFSGNTILGDGTVIMILDPNGIARATGEVEVADQAAQTQDDQAGDQTARKTALLIFTAGKGAPKAVPLSLVSRLEEINISEVEEASGRLMIQYRGHLMPLVPCNPDSNILDHKKRPVLVFSDKSSTIGLVVDEIVDIAEEVIDVQVEGNSPGLLGSAIIREKATDVIDVGYFLNSVNKNWFKDHGDEPYQKDGGSSANTNRKRKILLVDDSPFFRNMLTPLLSVAGYDVTTLASPVEALKMCERGAQFDIIVSDIEMPDMDGFEFAEKIKSTELWQDTPLVALSSHATPQDISRGKQVGFNNYIAKFDREALLSTLSQALTGNKGEAA